MTMRIPRTSLVFSQFFSWFLSNGKLVKILRKKSCLFFIAASLEESEMNVLARSEASRKCLS